MVVEERREEDSERRAEEWGGGGGEGVKALIPSGSCATPARAQTSGDTRAELRARRHASRASPARMAVHAQGRARVQSCTLISSVYRESAHAHMSAS